MRSLDILTWHVHGNYLFYLSHIPHRIYLPVTPERRGDYMGKGSGFPWGDNVVEVPADCVRELDLDCVIFQRPEQYLRDQYVLLSPSQRSLPRIFVEHDPPRLHPTDNRHCVDDPRMLLVHVTAFNALMWDNGRTPVVVVPHGVVVRPDVRYTGERREGIVVVNHLARRGRRLGADIFEQVRCRVPLALIGMGADESGGIGEIAHGELASFISRYRFFFNPIRYTSLGLSVCEAMMLGMPVIAMATTEMAMTVQNGISGYVDTDYDRLVEHMLRLLDDVEAARRLGEGAYEYAKSHFSIERFIRDWDRALSLVTGETSPIYSCAR
jgi:glycosyltransferase involved in cell wall biosynthesis